jgi:hypothetical protein
MCVIYAANFYSAEGGRRCSGSAGRSPGLRREGFAGRWPAMRCLGNVVLRSLRGSLVVVIISKRDGPFPVYPTTLFNVSTSKKAVSFPAFIYHCISYDQEK